MKERRLFEQVFFVNTLFLSDKDAFSMRQYDRRQQRNSIDYSFFVGTPPFDADEAS